MDSQNHEEFIILMHSLPFWLRIIGEVTEVSDRDERTRGQAEVFVGHGLGQNFGHQEQMIFVLAKKYMVG